MKFSGKRTLTGRISERNFDRELSGDLVSCFYFNKRNFESECRHMLIITNNPIIKENVKDKEVLTLDTDYIGTLKKCRDLVHEGYELLSHPLYGSVKPNETPYRTVIIKKGKSLDTNSLNLIEDAIETANKFKNNKATPLWTERVLDDFRVIDFDIIRNTIQRMQYA